MDHEHPPATWFTQPFAVHALCATPSDMIVPWEPSECPGVDHLTYGDMRALADDLA